MASLSFDWSFPSALLNTYSVFLMVIRSILSIGLKEMSSEQYYWPIRPFVRIIAAVNEGRPKWTYIRAKQAGAFVLQGVNQLLWPAVCINCRQSIGEIDKGLCRDCWDQLLTCTGADYCRRCGRDAGNCRASVPIVRADRYVLTALPGPESMTRACAE